MLHFFPIDTVNFVIKYSFLLDGSSLEHILSSSFASGYHLVYLVSCPHSWFLLSFLLHVLFLPFFLQVGYYFYFATLYLCIYLKSFLNKSIKQRWLLYVINHLISGYLAVPKKNPEMSCSLFCFDSPS